MYSDKDYTEITSKIKKNYRVLIPIVAVFLGGFIAALIAGIKWLALTMLPITCVAACYGLTAYLLPNYRYRGFLRDMGAGLTREMRGSIVEVSDQEDYQDGARVLPVRVLLDAEQDERIVYLNVSKRDMFPEAGAHVALHCYGRHIRDCAVEA